MIYDIFLAKVLPLTYKFIQSKGWKLQSKTFREHSYFCSVRKKEFKNKTNLFPIAKERIIYQWFNREAIAKYEAQINNFCLLVKQKYQRKLIDLKKQKKKLRQRLRVKEIDNKQYQKLYTPVRKQIDDVEFHIWNICYLYRKRYFDCDRLKEIYRD